MAVSARPSLVLGWIVFGLFFSLQVVFWIEAKPYKPQLTVVPAVPGELAMKALAFGDEEFLFRLLGLNLQNFGDTFGRTTALRDYDFERLEGWFNLLDKLDDRSNYIPTLASYYFSQTQYPPDVIHVVRYLQQHSQHRINEKWWWQAQAVYLANHKLQDSDLALELAKPLLHAREVPIWVNQLPAFIYEKRGEYGDALRIMEHVRQNADDLKPGELNFIRHFIEERIGAISAQQQWEEGKRKGAP